MLFHAVAARKHATFIPCTVNLANKTVIWDDPKIDLITGMHCISLGFDRRSAVNGDDSGENTCHVVAVASPPRRPQRGA